MYSSYPVIDISAKQKKNIDLFNTEVSKGKYRLEEVPCNLCGSEKRKILFKNDRYGICQHTVVCMKCGLVYSSPRLTAKSTEKFYRSDEYRNIYEGGSTGDIFLNRYKNALSYRYDPSIPYKYMELMFVDFLNEKGIVFNSVCEIGAGGGTNLIPFKRMGKEVAGFDYSKELVSLGRKKGINISQGSIEDMEESYDLIMLIHVLEHFLNPVEQLKNLRNYCKKYLFIEIPGMVNQAPSLQNAHFYYFSLNTLLYCICRAGFKIVDYRTIETNDYIMALFEKNSGSFYDYDFTKEIGRVLRIIRKFKSRNMVKNIIKSLPFGEKILDGFKSFFKKEKIKKF